MRLKNVEQFGKKVCSLFLKRIFGKIAQMTIKIGFRKS
jgi:hypothetical protein